MLRLYRSLLVAAAVTSAALGCSGPVAAVAASPAWATMAAGQSLQLRAMPERSEEHTSELQSQSNLVCRLLLEKKKHNPYERKPLRKLRLRSHSCVTPIAHAV